MKSIDDQFQYDDPNKVRPVRVYNGSWDSQVVKTKCPRCGTLLIPNPLLDYAKLNTLFYVMINTFCPKCDRIEICDKCGHKRIIGANGRVVEQADTPALGAGAARHVGSTPSVPTKKKRKRGRSK